MEHDTILVIDYGTSTSQTGHLIARGIRRSHVYSEIVPADKLQEYVNKRVKGLVLPGGPDSVYEEDAPKPFQAFDYELPVLGVCYGHQFIAHAKGGDVRPGEKKEFGRTRIKIIKNADLMKGIPSEDNVWMSHGDYVQRLPDGFDIYAKSEVCPIAAFGNDDQKLYGVQFHPELLHTDNGELILKNFATEIAGCEPTWTMGSYLTGALDKVKRRVADGSAIVALSGGVDSAVTAALGFEALGDKLKAVFVDSGGMRYGEVEEVVNAFESRYKNKPIVIDAADRFMEALDDVADPEQKRLIAGNMFAKIFLEQAEKIGAQYLFQGTIYPDIIETRGKIKSHHNLHPSIWEYFGKDGRLVEPLTELYKDEVRDLGTELGLPENIVHRQPFPGPGLYIRIEGPVTNENKRMAGHSDKILREEVDKLPFKKRPWQYFTFVSKSEVTGVKGDKRAFGTVIYLRAVTSRDGMSADFWRPDWEILERISTRIVNEVDGVVDVSYDITGKPPRTIEFE